MDTGTWIAVFIPLFTLFLVILPQQQLIQKSIIWKRNKRRRLNIMLNELIQKYIGMKCQISTGSFGTAVTGEIVNVDENWIEVKTKKGIELINAEFVQSIKIN